MKHRVLLLTAFPPHKLFVAVMVVVALGPIFENSAIASCGDYVTIGNPRGVHDSSGQAHSNSPMPDQAADIAPSDHVPVCQGAHCRWSIPPAAPILPPHGELTNTLHELALDGQQDASPSLSKHRWHDRCVLSGAQTCRGRLERPPQLDIR